MPTIVEQCVQFDFLFLLETKEPLSGSSGSCQGDGIKTDGNESLPVCQRPSSSLSLHSISSEFIFSKLFLDHLSISKFPILIADIPKLYLHK